MFQVSLLPLFSSSYPSYLMHVLEFHILWTVHHDIQGVIKKFRDWVIENYNLLPVSKNI